MPTSLSIGYEGLSNLVVTSINNQDIRKLEDIDRAVNKTINGFHKICVKQFPKVIYLDNREIKKINRQIKRRYQLPMLKNLN